MMKITYLAGVWMIGLAASALWAGEIAVNGGFEQGGGDAPTGWHKGGTAPAGCVWSIAGGVNDSRSIKLKDDSEKTYANWVLTVTPLPAGAKSLTAKWSWKYDVIGGHFRASVTFYKADNTLAGQGAHVHVTGKQEDWAAGELNADVPEGATRFAVEFVTGGAMETQGTMTLDDISITTQP